MREAADFHLIVWVLKAEVAVLTEEETVVLWGARGLSCHGPAESGGGTSREVGLLLRRIEGGLRLDHRGRETLLPTSHHQSCFNGWKSEKMRGKNIRI